jgi:hypothetical protein
MVWNEGNRGPTVKHLTERLARDEAERLARINPGQLFHVLALVATCKINYVTWEESPLEVLPF